MKWIRISIKTTTMATDLVSNLLSELNFEGIEVIDKIPLSEKDKDEMFIDILPPLEENDGSATINTYIETDKDIDKVVDEIKKGLENISSFFPIGEGTIELSTTEEKDWLNNWKEHFKPFRIYDNIIIKPTWETLEEVSEGDIVVEMDPGVSFGTGTHETTKLCVIGLKKHLKAGSTLLDVGSGSGILSIIGQKLGAREVLGIDIDPRATVSAFENAKANKIEIQENKFTFETGDIINDHKIRSEIGETKYDMVVANILADIIVSLSNVINDTLKPGGIFISSGILESKEIIVEDALLANGFRIIEKNKMGEWVSFVAQSAVME